MITEPDLILERIDRAMQRQSWREAWVLLEEANPDYQSGDRHLGARRQDFIMFAAHCQRHRGQMPKADELYELLLNELPLNDYRFGEALMGKAELLHAGNQHGEAMQLLRVASCVPNKPEQLEVRLQTIISHVLSHLNIEQSLKSFEQTIKDFPGVKGSVGANLYFFYGDALLVAGRYEESERQLLKARALAEEGGCAVSLADTMRRLPLVRTLSGNRARAMSDAADVANALQLYRTAGDRGEVFLHTEHGEVMRSLGKLREAESEFSRGLWASREINDLNRVGHNQLGLFEVSRQSLRPKPELLDEAEAAYSKARSDWGKLHVLISRALHKPEQRKQYLLQAAELISQSDFSGFEEERKLIAWMRSAPENQLDSELHLMNYP